MKKEMQMTHTLKILIAVFAAIMILGGGFVGWLYYSGALGTKLAEVSAVPAKKADANQAEMNAIQNEIQKSDDIDISDLDDTANLDKIDLSGI